MSMSHSHLLLEDCSINNLYFSQYADPVLDKLDVHKVVSHRLFRESCYNHKGNYVKVGITDVVLLPRLIPHFRTYLNSAGHPLI